MSVGNVAQKSSSFQAKKKLTPWSTGKDKSTSLFWRKMEKSEKKIALVTKETPD